MSVVVVGIDHQHAPLDLLERVTLGEADLGKALGTLRDSANFQESVVLSTCLRTEVYAVVDRFHDAVEEIRALLAARAGAPLPVVEEHSSVRFDDDVAAHLFAVASGLESAVPGEGEVLGQVRRAWERAHEERVSGPVLAELFRHAVQSGKRVRSETAIARGTTSFAHAAVELAEQARPAGLGGTRVVVAGAGELGAGVVRAITGLPPGRRPAETVVVNRTLSRAAALATDGVRSAGLSELGAVVAGADVLLTAVEAEAHAFGAAVLGDRSARPLLVVDLGLPRNVDPAAAAADGCTVLDLDDLRSAVGRAVDERKGEFDQARTIAAEDIDRYRAAVRARGAAPVVAALRGRLEDLRRAELDRRRGQFGELTDGTWDQVDSVTRAVLGKLLHDPTTLLKEAAGTARGERLVEALRTLFDL
ncbi:MAG: glutamyl-tRNA reductase [Acidimicrobiales bacterium]